MTFMEFVLAKHQYRISNPSIASPGIGVRKMCLHSSHPKIGSPSSRSSLSKLSRHSMSFLVLALYMPHTPNHLRRTLTASDHQPIVHLRVGKKGLVHLTSCDLLSMYRLCIGKHEMHSLNDTEFISAQIFF